MKSKFRWTLFFAALMAGSVLAPQSKAADEGPRWWKGNLHTHSLWSDGDDYPEMIADWYKNEGYDFLMLSDHNTLQIGERWIDLEKNKGGTNAFNKYLERLGEDWVETREKDGRRQVRLKTLEEFRSRYEEPGKFLMIQGEEITAHFLPGPGKRTVPVHVNATNLKDPIIPQSGSSVAEVLRKNVLAVIEQRRATGRPMFPHLNHPNFHYAVTAEDLAQVTEEKFFEVYNGHPAVRNEGDKLHAGTERIWDIVLTGRLGEMNAGLIYGVATDDSHNYHAMSMKRSNSGRGWVVVRAPDLSAGSLVKAMEAGDFYASTGVELHDIEVTSSKLKIAIKPTTRTEYTTFFIGTRKGYDKESKPVTDAEGNPVRATRIYSEDVGEVLARVEGVLPAYSFRGDEIYVRAKIVSSRPKQNPGNEGEMESAWVQPVVRKR